jgi:hypothetical protein
MESAGKGRFDVTSNARGDSTAGTGANGADADGVVAERSAARAGAGDRAWPTSADAAQHNKTMNGPVPRGRRGIRFGGIVGASERLRRNAPRIESTLPGAVSVSV